MCITQEAAHLMANRKQSCPQLGQQEAEVSRNRKSQGKMETLGICPSNILLLVRPHLPKVYSDSKSTCVLIHSLGQSPGGLTVQSDLTKINHTLRTSLVPQSHCVHDSDSLVGSSERWQESQLSNKGWHLSVGSHVTAIH